MSLQEFGNFLKLEEKASFIKEFFKDFIKEISSFFLPKINITAQEQSFHFIMIKTKFIMRCLKIKRKSS